MGQESVWEPLRGTTQTCCFSFTPHRDQQSWHIKRQRRTDKKSCDCQCQPCCESSAVHSDPLCKGPQPHCAPCRCHRFCLPGALNDLSFQNPQVINIFRNPQVLPTWMDSSLCVILCYCSCFSEKKTLTISTNTESMQIWGKCLFNMNKIHRKWEEKLVVLTGHQVMPMFFFPGAHFGTRMC